MIGNVYGIKIKKAVSFTATTFTLQWVLAILR